MGLEYSQLTPEEEATILAKRERQRKDADFLGWTLHRREEELQRRQAPPDVYRSALVQAISRKVPTGSPLKNDHLRESTDIRDRMKTLPNSGQSQEKGKVYDIHALKEDIRKQYDGYRETAKQKFAREQSLKTKIADALRRLLGQETERAKYEQRISKTDEDEALTQCFYKELEAAYHLFDHAQQATSSGKRDEGTLVQDTIFKNPELVRSVVEAAAVEAHALRNLATAIFLSREVSARELLRNDTLLEEKLEKIKSGELQPRTIHYILAGRILTKYLSAVSAAHQNTDSEERGRIENLVSDRGQIKYGLIEDPYA